MEDDECREWRPPSPPHPFVLDSLLCPITHMMMRSPVLASDGSHYDKEALESWLRMGGGGSPKTREPLTGQVEDAAVKGVVASVLAAWRASLEAWLGGVAWACEGADACVRGALKTAGDAVFTSAELACMLVRLCPTPGKVPAVAELLREAGWYCRRCGDSMSVLHEQGVDLCAECLVRFGRGLACADAPGTAGQKWFLHFETGATHWTSASHQRSVFLMGPWEGVDAACQAAFLRPAVPLHLVSMPADLSAEDEDLVRALSKATHGQCSVYSGTRLLAGPRRVLPEHIVSTRAGAA